MEGLTLERVHAGLHRLAGVGTLQRAGRWGAVIEAGGRSWQLSRALLGLGQIINVIDRAGGARAARYVPHGPLHLRGIYGGTVESGPRRYEWRANRQMGSSFVLSASGRELARLEAGPPAQPVRIRLVERDAVEPLVLLLCCHIVLQSLYTAEVAAVAAAGVATSG